MSDSDNICLICLECESDKSKKCYKMSSIFNYIKQCECDCIVHVSCLRQWHELENNKCIICKQIVFINNSNYNQIVSPDLYKFQENMIGVIKFMILILILIVCIYQMLQMIILKVFIGHIIIIKNLTFLLIFEKQIGLNQASRFILIMKGLNTF
jgi:hypothetical protein